MSLFLHAAQICVRLFCAEQLYVDPFESSEVSRIQKPAESSQTQMCTRRVFLLRAARRTQDFSSVLEEQRADRSLLRSGPWLDHHNLLQN